MNPVTTKDAEELVDNHVCTGCIGEAFLAELIRKESRRRRCAYCRKRSAGISLDDLADRIGCAFEQHFKRSATEPDGIESMMMKFRELDYDWEREGEPAVQAIANAAEVSEELATDLRIVLAARHADMDAAQIGEETEFDDEIHYKHIIPSSREWRERWYEFERTLKERTRFFSSSCHDQLEAIFAGIDTMPTQNGEAVIQELAPASDDALFYRARVFFHDAEVEKALKRPDLEIAPPPSKFTSAGRMNAKGISVFYGANTVAGALAEIRPPVGSKVVVGEFRPLRSVRLLNLPALEAVRPNGSIFDPGYADVLSRMGFVHTLSGLMSRPVMPRDVDFDYLPTQAAADFLAHHRTYNLDGIRFTSVQTGRASHNIVLFHKASRVRLLDIPEGTDLSARSSYKIEDIAEPDYRVTERVPAPDEDVEKPEALWSAPHSHSLDTDEPDHDPREETLTVDANTLSVHWIDTIDVTTTSFDVGRYRYEQPRSVRQTRHDF